MFRFIRNAIVAATLVACMATGAHAATLEAVEFYNATLDHYFVTASSLAISFADAVSFEVMRRERLTHAFAFDKHFVTAGFKLLD